MFTPLELVERQFKSYNERNLESFLTNFSETFKSYRMPTETVTIDGKAQLAHFYATERFNRTGLKAELISRTVMGNKVIDFERISGIKDEPVETLAIFEIKAGLIETAWFFS